MRSLLGFVATLVFSYSAGAADAPYKAGTASKVITPTGPLWMAGYGGRNKECEAKTHDLWAKAVAIEDGAGNAAILLTSDLCGIPRSLSEEVTAAVVKETSLKREQLMLTCSHTHCGPVVAGNLMDMYPVNAEQAERIVAYTQKLRLMMTEVMVKAWKERKPATLSHGKGTARFAVNRRQVNKDGISNGTNPTGPVDHDVPVLRVQDEKGKTIAVVFGYACHNTTMPFYEWCGDYAGFAQIEIEKKHPGALALFWIGCGADANPLPRGKIELCEKYGKELATAVNDVLADKMSPLSSKLATKYKEITLNFDAIPAKEKWETDAISKNIALANRAKRLLKHFENGGKIPDHYSHYPVQVWKFGDDVTWVSLGGEVVVDYSIRLKKDLGKGKPLWITGYANDVIAYIPSERVLKEGGYEADSSQIYYGHPTKWAPGLEEKIITTVLELAK